MKGLSTNGVSRLLKTLLIITAALIILLGLRPDLLTDWLYYYV